MKLTPAHHILNSDEKIQFLFNVEVRHITVEHTHQSHPCYGLLASEAVWDVVCRLWPADAPHLLVLASPESVPLVRSRGSRVTLSHPSQDHVLDSNSSSIMQWRREISCLLGCGQDNMVTLSVHYTSSLYGSRLWVWSQGVWRKV